MSVTGVLAVLLAAAAAAPDPDKAQIEQARVLIRDLDENRALELLAQYLTCTPPEVCARLAPGLRARALMYAAVAQFEQGNEAGARLRVVEWLAAEPSATAPPWTSPRFRALFDEVRLVQKLATPPPEPKRGPAPAVWISLGASAALTVACYAVSSLRYQAAQSEPRASTALIFERQSKGWFYAFDAFAAASGALLLTAGLWWLIDHLRPASS